MKKYIKVKKSTSDLTMDFVLPQECMRFMFLPMIGWNSVNYYYLLDFKKKLISCWEVDTKELCSYLKEHINMDDIDNIPWNKGLDSYLEAINAIHSARFYNDKVYLYSNNSKFALVFNINDDSYEVIDSNPDSDEIYVISSTNDIYNNCMYYSRWKLSDVFQYTKLDYISVDICKLNLNNNDLQVIDTVKGMHDIHTTTITPDGKKIILVQMNRDPNVPFPKDDNDKIKETMLKILDGGTKDSTILVYDLESRTYETQQLKYSPAHIEYDQLDSNYFYLSRHNTCLDNNVNRCFGKASIDKIRIENNSNKIDFISTFERDDFIRIPEHTTFVYGGKSFVAASAYPNQLYIIDADTMKLVKSVYTRETGKKDDFSNGPFAYPIIDRTPYGVNPINNSPYILLTNTKNITIYDFVKEEQVGTISYNFNNKAFFVMGHCRSYGNCNEEV